MQNIWIPYLISNLVGLILLAVCYVLPRLGQIVFGLIFLVAGVFNFYMALTAPEVYPLGFGESAWLGFYRDFIYGAFSRHTAAFVSAIAGGQILVGAFLLLKKQFLRFGLAGGIVFFVAIAPLGTGSAFPSSLIMAAALFVLYLKRAAL